MIFQILRYNDGKYLVYKRCKLIKLTFILNSKNLKSLQYSLVQIASIHGAQFVFLPETQNTYFKTNKAIPAAIRGISQRWVKDPH